MQKNIEEDITKIEQYMKIIYMDIGKIESKIRGQGKARYYDGKVRGTWGK